MMTNMELSVSLTGPDIIALLRAVENLPPFNQKTPVRIMVDSRAKKVTPDCIDKWAISCKRDIMVFWGDDEEDFISYNKHGIVKASIHDFPRDAKAVLTLISPLPWTVATFRSIHDVWSASDNMYLGQSFSDMHFSHGWGCAFKGEGHNRLVSRRWLEFGPWYLHHGSNDISLVQFHDLEADAITALEQAKIGHERMGISNIGGYLQSDYVYTHKLSGLYEPEQRLLKIIVHGRDVSQTEMLDACAARYYQALGSTQPIENVAYIFMEETEARKHLHELWLRGLECRAIIKGEEVWLDSDYHPIPDLPEWVRQLQQQASRRANE